MLKSLQAIAKTDNMAVSIQYLEPYDELQKHYKAFNEEPAVDLKCVKIVATMFDMFQKKPSLAAAMGESGLQDLPALMEEYAPKAVAFCQAFFAKLQTKQAAKKAHAQAMQHGQIAQGEEETSSSATSNRSSAKAKPKKKAAQQEEHDELTNFHSRLPLNGKPAVLFQMLMMDLLRRRMHMLKENDATDQVILQNIIDDVRGAQAVWAELQKIIGADDSTELTSKMFWSVEVIMQCALADEKDKGSTKDARAARRLHASTHSAEMVRGDGFKFAHHDHVPRKATMYIPNILSQHG